MYTWYNISYVIRSGSFLIMTASSLNMATLFLSVNLWELIVRRRSYFNKFKSRYPYFTWSDYYHRWQWRRRKSRDWSQKFFQRKVKNGPMSGLWYSNQRTRRFFKNGQVTWVKICGSNLRLEIKVRHALCYMLRVAIFHLALSTIKY